jgi:glycosyltransferase involved in cell wall biosynthesis
MARLRDILELLDSIAAQSYSNIETIFVAERSQELFDRVRDYIREKGILNTKVVFNSGEPGASAARNLGIKQASGDIIAFVDDDSLLFPDWAEGMIKTYDDASIIGVTGPAFPLWQDKPITWFPEEFYWIIGCTAWFKCDGIREMRNVWLQNASFCREAFELAGLIDIGLGPQDSTLGFKGRELRKGVISEEVELSLRVKKASGKRIVFNPKVRVKHRVYNERLKLSYIIRWARWMGVSKHKLKNLYPQADDGPLSQEHQLLKRILTRLFPSILKTLFTSPATAWRKLKVTLAALIFVALGYFSDWCQSLLSGQKAVVH